MANVPAPDRNPSGYSGLRESLGGIAGSAALYLRARLHLVQLEAGEALASWFKLVLCIGVALLLCGLAYVGVIAGLIVWISSTGFPLHWTIFIAAALHLVFAVLIVWIGKARYAVPGFSQSLDEFRKDAEWLIPKTGKNGNHG